MSEQLSHPATAGPPGHRYRLLTGPDDAAFCERVSAALAEGYLLHGSPSVTFDGSRVIAAQAVLWPSDPESPTVEVRPL
ncbi:DUF1737 domain-containing protein [Ruania alkalisoli]|uniref:DUF1737 domain-containing protein n=1 Tax=Ruania alkalisoli TaxID=2779775 RepID=A0A7M1SUK7_9MICO|nr:DUF1737 domain-containing protein [Ruania alkalisoli]QOR71270.1 DUF1737 domain-containing protein [Ruania alkalisoli]